MGLCGAYLIKYILNIIINVFNSTCNIVTGSMYQLNQEVLDLDHFHLVKEVLSTIKIKCID